MTHRWEMAQGVRDGATPGMGPLASRVASARGLTGEGAASFLRPRMADLHDPSLLPGADRAAARLLEAARAGERIVIYGDYDVDGVSATAILFHTIRAVAPGADVRTYVPHRIDEGYGLHTDAIESLAADGARVIVSVDCGVTAHEQAARARALGVDLIITDHHNAPGTEALPRAWCIVHPGVRAEDGGEYPFRDLCGAGVAFKVAWRIATLAAGSDRVGPEMQTLLLDMLALASLGTVADVVPLVGENRIIARYGLGRLRSSPIPGLRALIAASNLDGERIEAEDVGFRLGPRLNACGRMGHARDAVELLTVAEGARADELAVMLARLNDRRRADEQRITEEALALAESAGMTGSGRLAVVLASEGWSPGVVGIVCSRLVERLRRPTLLLQRENGLCQGSGRSVEGFNLHGALQECEALLERYGGHDMAAGLAVRVDRFEAFADRFTSVANERLAGLDLSPSLRVDCDATVMEMTAEAVGQLSCFAPFGRDNPAPLVRVQDARLLGAPEPLGAHGKHVALRVSQGGAAMRIVGWGWGERRGAIAGGSALDLVVEPKVSRWGGRVSVEPTLRDLRVR